jgi:hypothetical protein
MTPAAELYDELSENIRIERKSWRRVGSSETRFCKRSTQTLNLGSLHVEVSGVEVALWMQMKLLIHLFSNEIRRRWQPLYERFQRRQPILVSPAL